MARRRRLGHRILCHLRRPLPPQNLKARERERPNPSQLLRLRPHVGVHHPLHHRLLHLHRIRPHLLRHLRLRVRFRVRAHLRASLRIQWRKVRLWVPICSSRCARDNLILQKFSVSKPLLPVHLLIRPSTAQAATVQDEDVSMGECSTILTSALD
jgi:hypothetical protein